MSTISSYPKMSVLTGAEYLLGNDASDVTKTVLLTTLRAFLSGQLFGTSITAALASSQNDYGPLGYVPGITNRLKLTPPTGGATLTGLLAPALPTFDGVQLLIRNQSTTGDQIVFTHESGSSQTLNQFWCPNGVSAKLPAGAGVILIYDSGLWTFT